MAKHNYVKISKERLPEKVRFDVPPQNQGQIVEVAYGGFGRHEHCAGDPYMKTTDRSDRSVEYYRLEAKS